MVPLPRPPVRGAQDLNECLLPTDPIEWPPTCHRSVRRFPTSPDFPARTSGQAGLLDSCACFLPRSTRHAPRSTASHSEQSAKINMRISGVGAPHRVLFAGKPLCQVRSACHEATYRSSPDTSRSGRAAPKMRKSENFGAFFERMSIGVHSAVGCVSLATKHRLPRRGMPLGAFAWDRT
jgi:hypothetical protein